MEPTPALTPIGPFETGFKPVQEITPFTYQDGFTYLQKLEVLAYYVNNKLVGTVNEIITANSGFQTNVADTINAFTAAQDAAMKALASSLIQYQVVNNTDGTLDYMMEDGSHVSLYTVAEIQALLATQDARLTQFQATLNGAIKDQNDTITANDAAQTAAIAAVSSQLPLKQWYIWKDFVKDYHADPTGATASDDAWDAAIADCYANQGLKLHIPRGRYLATRLWHTDTKNQAVPYPYMPPLEIVGDGCLGTNTAGGDEFTPSDSNTMATFIDSSWQNFNNDGFGCVTFDTIGKVKVSNLSFINSKTPTSTTPMVCVNRAQITMEECSFHGHSSLSKRTCVQTGIFLGSTNIMYSGYGCSFRDIQFDRIGIQFYFSHDANNVYISNVVGSQTCGLASDVPTSGRRSSAVYMCPLAGYQITANTIVNYFIEGDSYDNFIGSGGNVRGNTFIGCSLWDSGETYFFMAETSNGATPYGNTFINPWFDDRDPKFLCRMRDGAGVETSGLDHDNLNVWIQGNRQSFSGGTRVGRSNNTLRGAQGAQTGNGTIIYNTDTNTLQAFVNGAWATVTTS